MKFGIVKTDISSKKIIDFIESFDDLQTHLKMQYSDITFVSNSDARSIRKNDSYLADKDYILLDNPKATLYKKTKVPVEGIGGYVWSDTPKLEELCSWELIELDIRDDDNNSPSPRTVEFRNFNMKLFDCGSVCITYEEYTDDINSLLATLLNKVDKSLRCNSLIISDKLTGAAFQDVEISQLYDTHLINSKIQVPDKKVIFVDTSVGVDGNNYNHLLKIMENSKNTNTIIAIVRRCDILTKDLVLCSDHLMLLNSINKASLELMYEFINIKDLFSTTASFVSIFKQLTSKFGTMIISPKKDSLDIVSWYRL